MSDFWYTETYKICLMSEWMNLLSDMSTLVQKITSTATGESTGTTDVQWQFKLLLHSNHQTQFRLKCLNPSAWLTIAIWGPKSVEEETNQINRSWLAASDLHSSGVIFSCPLLTKHCMLKMLIAGLQSEISHITLSQWTFSFQVSEPPKYNMCFYVKGVI